MENMTENNHLDDVFGSPPDSPLAGFPQGTVNKSQNDYSDIPRLRNIHVTNGYREGISSSKETSIQAGFDEGYNLGAEIGLRIGWCLGVLHGLQDVSLSPDSTSQAIAADDFVDLLARAESELTVENIFAATYFAPDGVWLYPILKDGATGEEDEESITFDIVAAAHPLLKKWVAQIESISKRLGLEVTPTWA